MQPALCKATWNDPERRDSIIPQPNARMDWRFKPPFRTMTCWSPQNPAQACLTVAFNQIQALFAVDTVRDELWQRMTNYSVGYSFDRFMHGKNIHNAQPTIIFSSKSSVLRSNAAKIINNENIEVDRRGIGLEFYSNGPVFSTRPHSLGFGSDSPRLGKSKRQDSVGAVLDNSGFINGVEITTSIASSTIGGIISVDGELFGITVAHAFLDNVSQISHNETSSNAIFRFGIRVGTLAHKSRKEQEAALDWALCDLDAEKVTLSNKVILPDQSKIFPSEVAKNDPSNSPVWVFTSFGCIRGSIKADYSLVALPGSRILQKMWVVVLDRQATLGDCGSWVIDVNDGNRLYGYIVASKEGTDIAYVVLMRDVFADICTQLGKSDISIPSEKALARARGQLIQPSGGGKNDPWMESCVLSFGRFSISPFCFYELMKYADGGGVRSLSSLYILRDLMEAVRRIERRTDPIALSSFHPLESHRMNQNNATDENKKVGEYLPCHYFDYMAGTSTGGLIAIMLSRLKMDVDDTIKEFILLSDKIFGSPRFFSMRGPILWNRNKYNSNSLQTAIGSIVARYTISSKDVGLPRFSSDPDLCKTIVIAYRKTDEGRESPYLFRSYDHQGDPYRKTSWVRNPGQANVVDIALVARATSAAPTYFKSVKIENSRFRDGGFGFNNPALEAYHEVQDMHNSSNAAVALLVSVGTGSTPFRPIRRSSSGISELYRSLKTVKVLVSDSNMTHETLDTIIGSERSETYFRLNVEGENLAKVKVDQWKKKDDITKFTNEYLIEERTKETIEKIAQLLVIRRRLRSKTVRWEERVLGIKYRCLQLGCSEGQKVQRKEELEKHLEEFHAFGPPDKQSPEVKSHYEQLMTRGRYQEYA